MLTKEAPILLISARKYISGRGYEEVRSRHCKDRKRVFVRRCFFDKMVALTPQLISYDYPYLYKFLMDISLEKSDQSSDRKWPIPRPMK